MTKLLCIDITGGIRMSSLKHTLSYILEDDQSSPKIPQVRFEPI